MDKNKKSFFRKPVIPSIKCKCGKTLFKRSRINYPFGKKSKPVKNSFYKCIACGFSQTK